MGVRVCVRHTGCVKELTNFLLHILQSCIHHVDRAASLLVFRVCRFPKRHFFCFRRSITRKLHHVSIHHLPLIQSHQQQLSRVFQTLPSSCWGGDLQAFPGQMRYIISPLGSGSTSGSLPSWACPENLQREAPGRLPVWRESFSENPPDI